MTAIQIAFLVALTVVVLAVIGFALMIGVGALRTGTGVFVQTYPRSPSQRADVDRWAFYAHRLTGFAVFGFLCLHVLDVSLYAVSSRLYTQAHQLYGSAPLRLFECGLLFAILFHTFNGLRILATDLGGFDSWTQRRALYGAVALTVLLGVAGSVVILTPVFS